MFLSSEVKQNDLYLIRVSILFTFSKEKFFILIRSQLEKLRIYIFIVTHYESMDRKVPGGPKP